MSDSASPPQAPPPVGHLPGSSGYRRTLIGLMFGGLANFALLYYVQPLLPTLVERYGIDPAQSAMALSVSTLALAVGLVFVGPLADRFGRVPVMRWSLLASGLIGIASAFAPPWELLLVLRAADGVALAGLPAVALAYLREEVNEAHHVQANAAYITGTALGGALGRLLPWPLAVLGGWTLATASIGVLTLAAAVVLWVLLPASEGFRPREASIWRRAAGTLAAPRDPVIALVCVAGFATMGVFVGVYNAAAFRLESPPLDLGEGIAFVYLAYLVGIPAPVLMGWLSQRIGPAGSALVGIGLLALGVGLMLITAVPLLVMGLAILTFAFLGTHSLMSGWIVDRAHRRGTSTASAASAYLLAYYVGSAVVGVLAVREWEAFGWIGVTVLAGILCLVAVGALALAGRLDRRGPRGRTVRLPR